MSKKTFNFFFKYLANLVSSIEKCVAFLALQCLWNSQEENKYLLLNMKYK